MPGAGTQERLAQVETVSNLKGKSVVCPSWRNVMYPTFTAQVEAQAALKV